MFELGVASALVSAAAFGGGDFAGGVASRRAPALVVAAIVQGLGLVALLVVLLIVRPAPPTPDVLLFGSLAGVTGALGLVALYRAMALGSIGIASALSAAGGAVVPVVFTALVTRQLLPPMQLLGVLCAVGAGLASSRIERTRYPASALAHALAAAAFFGAWFLLLDRAAQADLLWALVILRVAGTLLVAALAAVAALASATQRGGIGGGTAAFLVIPAVLDLAGNALFAVASRLIDVGVAAALAGMYPVVAMLLARAIAGEVPPRLGYLGIALAVAGIALISLGR